uniref:Uncharacterized protein n=1 Tax=Arcella intermedia TaxID=1963864 RepID=A0A6B2LVJ9_9EUKA
MVHKPPIWSHLWPSLLHKLESLLKTYLLHLHHITYHNGS